MNDNLNENNATTRTEGRQKRRSDRFGAVQFTNAAAVKDGQTLTPAAAGATAVTMVNNETGVTLDTPSALGPDGESFAVTRG